METAPELPAHQERIKVERAIINSASAPEESSSRPIAGDFPRRSVMEYARDPGTGI
jgi:hypothetical protein